MELPFSGFTDNDFAIFELPDFAARMPALKATITPKLKDLGDSIAPRLSEVYGQTLYPHVAQHLRRSVNAPVATWVAFAKEKRAYKPYVHLRAAISGDEFRLVVFVEDYADDKERFAKNLVRQAKPVSAYLVAHPVIRAYTIASPDGEPLRGEALNAKTIRAFGERLGRVKGQHAVFGVAWNRSHPVLASGPQMLDALVEAAKELHPLYVLGDEPK